VSYRAIALSQVDGAGGESIGLSVARHLGFGYLDEAIVAQVARDHGLEPTTVMEAERKRAFFADIGERTRRGAVEGPTTPPPNTFDETDSILSLIREAVRSAADRGNAVLVAHAASYACAERTDVLRVCVTAPFATRARRYAAALGLEEAEALDLLHQSDARRASYLQRVYGVDDEAPTDYDTVVNTERLTPDAAVSLITGLVGSHPVSDEPGYGAAGVGHLRT
jgi:cytidylate kinase